MKDGYLISCPHCAGLILIPLSHRAEYAQELLRQRRIQKEAGTGATDGSPDQVPISEAPAAKARAS